MLFNNERALEKWLKFEYQNLNKNLVTHQVAVSELLEMDEPKTVTRAGEEYRFDIEYLNKFVEAIPRYYHRRLRLPITLYRDLRVRDSCFITDTLCVFPESSLYPCITSSLLNCFMRF